MFEDSEGHLKGGDYVNSDFATKLSNMEEACRKYLTGRWHYEEFLDQIESLGVLRWYAEEV